MAKSDVAVLDFGSSKLTLLVGHRTVNNNFSITASSDIDYAGFMDGEFLEETALLDDISFAVSEINKTLDRPITKLYVGVPSEFCMMEHRILSKNFAGRTRLNAKKIDALFLNADKEIESETHSVINVSPLYFQLDNSNITFEPLDCYCKSINVEACFILADDRFISLINQILISLGIKDIEYVCSTLAQGEYLFAPEHRNHGVLMVDCGYLTSTVAYFKGEGMTEFKSFSLGGGQITADLSEGLKLPFMLAEQVKQNLLITVKATGLDYYEAYNKNNKLEKVQSVQANEIALNTIDEIISNIKSTIESFEIEPNDYETLYLTGGGLSYLKGIKFYMSRELGRKVEIVSPRPLKFKRPDISSVISLLDAALNMEK